MPKIAMIGAGSLVFCKTLVMDILATDALKASEICLMNRTKPKLDRMEAFVQKVIMPCCRCAWRTRQRWLPSPCHNRRRHRTSSI